jgi:CRP/FNR family transcriptional regulator, cyclic AMP receptor protein
MSTQLAGLKWELKRHALFASFDEPALEQLIRVGVVRVFHTREELFHEGDPGGSMFIVLSGKVKVSAHSASGKECVLSFAGPGEVLGEITLLDGGDRTATGCAMEDTRVLCLSRSDFLPVLEKNPVAALHIISLLCERLRNTSQLVEDTAFLAAGPRLARALLRLVAQHGAQEDGVWRLSMRLPQSTLGAHVGLMRESVNRQLRAWQEEGVIDSSEDGLTVLDRDHLERIAEMG